MRLLQQYQRYQVETASMEDSVALLYDGARRFVDKALVALGAEDYAEVARQTAKAQQILEELQLSLRMDAGPIAHELSRLYDYWIWRLGQGLLRKDPIAFEEVSTVLADMQEAWAQAASQMRALRAAQGLGVVPGHEQGK